MKKRKLCLSKKTIGLWIAAVLLLSFSSIGGTQAALQYYSEIYASRVQLSDIGVSLIENGTAVSWRNYDAKKTDGSWIENTGVLLENMLKEKEKLKLNYRYPEKLAVENSGTIDQYVRVTIYKYWVDTKGNKIQSLSPELIQLHLLTEENGWLLDETASTAERTVLYYQQILKGSANEKDAKKRTTPLFADSLTIDGIIANKVTQRQEDNVTITEYAYNGYSFVIEAAVDAVQTHNAEDAILSAWGKDVQISDNGTLALEKEGNA